MRLQRPGQHIRPVSMIASVSEWAWPVFGIRLDEKTAEIRNILINKAGRIPPPALHVHIQRVSRRQSANCKRSRKIYAKKQLYAIFPE